MVNSRMLHRLATNPRDYMEFATTGRLPTGIRPASPLITLLKAISPMDRIRIVGVRVCAPLGYTGSRQFHTAAQAFQWICPATEVFDGFPADSWRDKRFNQKLTLEILAEHCAKFPDELFRKYPALCQKPHPESASGPAETVDNPNPEA